MRSISLFLLAILLGATFGAAWIVMDLYRLPGGVFVKAALMVIVPLVDLAIIKHFVKTSQRFDMAWVLLFTVSAVLAFMLSAIILGLQGIK